MPKGVGTTSYEDKVWVLILDGELTRICTNQRNAKDNAVWYRSYGHKAAYALATVTWEEEK